MKIQTRLYSDLSALIRSIVREELARAGQPVAPPARVIPASPSIKLPESFLARIEVTGNRADFEPSAKLYSVYLVECAASKWAPGSQTMFGMTLKKLVPEALRTRQKSRYQGSDPVRGFFGVRLKTS